MTDRNITTELRNAKRLIIRGDGSFTVDPKGDWVSTRHFDEALAEIERLRTTLQWVCENSHMAVWHGFWDSRLDETPQPIHGVVKEVLEPYRRRAVDVQGEPK